MRPEKFTEAARRRRQLSVLRRNDPDWESPRPAQSSAKRSGEAVFPFEEAEGDLADLIRNFLRVRGSDALATELAGLLANAEWEWSARRDRQPDPSLPILGDIQPTPGQMRATIDEGRDLALKLREWSRTLPTALLLNETVSMTKGGVPANNDPAVRVVIECLAEKLDRLSALYQPRRGRPPGRREVAQWVAGPLMLFAYRHAPKATKQQRREFVRACLEQMKIECPDPNDHPSDFDRWFPPVETTAARGRARELARFQATKQ